MKKIILIVSTLLVLVVFNYSIYYYQHLKTTGQIVYLALVPVDPRSMLQGDYMRLSYAITQNLTAPQKKCGSLVITIGNNNIGTFNRFYTGEALADNEKLLHYCPQNYGIKIIPNNFMFQEGQAKFFMQAKYGVLKFDKENNYLLVGLANNQMEIIQAK